MVRERREYPTFIRSFGKDETSVNVIIFGKDPDQNHETVRFEFPIGTTVNGIQFHGTTYWKNWGQLGKWTQSDSYLCRDGTLDDVTNGIRDKVYKFCQAFFEEDILNAATIVASDVALHNKAYRIECDIENKLEEIEKLRKEVEMIDNSLNVTIYSTKS